MAAALCGSTRMNEIVYRIDGMYWMARLNVV